MQFFFNGRATGPKDSKVCVLYDPNDGSIIHIHGVTAVPGTELGSNSELERDAKQLAKSLGRRVQGAKTLHLSGREFAFGSPHKVDVKRRKLVFRRVPPRV